VAIGAGHAFKFASVIGRTLAELALDGGAAVDLGHFRIDRPILQQKDPPKSFMV
jgi:sarcosine oxidase